MHSLIFNQTHKTESKREGPFERKGERRGGGGEQYSNTPVNKYYIMPRLILVCYKVYYSVDTLMSSYFGARKHVLPFSFPYF